MKLKSTGTKRTASAKSTGRSREVSTARGYPYLALCVERGNLRASLQVGKAYRVVKPEPNDPPDRIRVIDEDGEDYLFPFEWFVPIEVERASRKKAMAAVG